MMPVIGSVVAVPTVIVGGVLALTMSTLTTVGNSVMPPRPSLAQMETRSVFTPSSAAAP